jgi:hypothetical protein
VVEALGDHEDRIRYENTRQKLAAGITKKRRKYEPRVFDGRVIMSDEIERIQKEVLKFERIEERMSIYPMVWTLHRTTRSRFCVTSCCCIIKIRSGA